ncbi:MAG: peptide deformylase [Ignavibacteria bacterium GWA2_55_11]|nr:MAG: peptide deformylase [Ignavibacteria bacterium GWA2_55_11]OGU44932.1 MAG: peptide deformylase [Ignavibacteria bacterium GWC2_56_12]OGU64849.1 MAG: peptide deformylase [Ignavibacteria bacterium RIFCSPHIGHO2_02_FULL_56_12]OGU71451.1 MAG: peptide deformylase [Ignavibacteria bacterium RIFCSPLOWO2_12_FULL_56_21]OGU74454.1 MAG: peptide deformylase [Ignavibacteria bacterium RIFCSPLOWO2_02_FULL_55_14]HAV23860.1 peptide deformylase [Bacteroidota bacterium]
MAILPIYLYGSDVLRAKAKPVTGVDDELVRLVMDMFATMHAANGIGLAANQVGATKRVIVIDISGVEDEEEKEAASPEPLHRTSPGLPTVLTLINPELLESSGAWRMEEGCLSIPEVRGEVERPEKVRLRFKDTSFKDVELTADGLLARVVQHEMDHLDGVLFIDHLSTTERALLSKGLRKAKKGEVETKYPIMSDRTS